MQTSEGQDLLGDEVAPVVKMPLDLWADFWKLYPKKIAKAAAVKMWVRLNYAEKLAAIEALPNHVAYWQALGTDKDKIPHAATWLNPKLGRRWEDEIEIPKPKAVEPAREVWRHTDKGWLQKGLELGVHSKPGEDWGSFKNRVSQALQDRARQV